MQRAACGEVRNGNSVEVPAPRLFNGGMGIRRQDIVVVVAIAAACAVLGVVMFAGGDEFVGWAWDLAALAAVPVFLLVALWRLRRRRTAEYEALGDENSVLDDPEGVRKTHEYLTAVTSMEARIGLLQRSQPYAGDQPPSPSRPAE